MPSSRSSSQPRDRTGVSCFAGRFLPSEPPGKPRGLQGPGIIGGRGRPVVPAAGIEGTQTQRPVRAEAARGRTTLPDASAVRDPLPPQLGLPLGGVPDVHVCET